MYDLYKEKIMLKEMKKQLIRKTIVAETKKQFLEKGIRKTTLRDIAKELEIAFGNIYYYYKSKTDICSVLWVEYTNAYLDFFLKKMNSAELKEKTGLEKIRYYYFNLFDYFEKNPLYAELIAFSMGEKPRNTKVPKEMKEIAKTARKRIQDTLIQIYKEGIADKSIQAEITNLYYEAWSFNISYVAIIINIIRYHEITEDVYDYYVDTYMKRLAKNGGKNEIV